MAGKRQAGVILFLAIVTTISEVISGHFVPMVYTYCRYLSPTLELFGHLSLAYILSHSLALEFIEQYRQEKCETFWSIHTKWP